MTRAAVLAILGLCLIQDRPLTFDQIRAIMRETEARVRAAELPALLLPRGRFAIVVEDAEGHRIGGFDARVA